MIVLCLLFGIYNLLRNVITKDVEGSTLSSNDVVVPSPQSSSTPIPSLVVPTTVQINIYINNTSPIYNQIYSQVLTQMPTLIATQVPIYTPTITVVPTSVPHHTNNPIPTATPTPMPTTIPLVSSFLGKYYNNKDLSGDPALIRTDPNINFKWNSESPDPKIQKDTFSVSWEGNLNTEAGNYLITISSDDGFRLYINDKIVLDRWINKPLSTEDLTLKFSHGSHPIRIDYFENLYSSTIIFNIKKL